MTLIEHLTLVEETRSEINRKHNLVDVMFLVISAIMSGAEGWNDIETYGDSKIDWLRQHRPLPTASRGVTVARILRCVSSIPCLKRCCAGSMNSALIRAKPITPLMARCYAAPFGEMPGCASVGHGLRYRKWAGVKPESNLTRRKSKPSKICWTFLS